MVANVCVDVNRNHGGEETHVSGQRPTADAARVSSGTVVLQILAGVYFSFIR